MVVQGIISVLPTARSIPTVQAQAGKCLLPVPIHLLHQVAVPVVALFKVVVAVVSEVVTHQVAITIMEVASEDADRTRIQMM